MSPAAAGEGAAALSKLTGVRQLYALQRAGHRHLQYYSEANITILNVL